MATRAIPTYFTCIVPYVPAAYQTEWHPTEAAGPFSVLTRGAFPTVEAAIDWARTHLGGTPYRIEVR